jgi:hypothetical protein
MFHWIKTLFTRNPTYKEFITYLRSDSIPVKDRVIYFYNYTHLFRDELHKPENRQDLYFLSDLVVK